MRKDYKPPSRGKKTAKRPARPGFAWFAAGFTTGIVVAVVAAYQDITLQSLAGAASEMARSRGNPAASKEPETAKPPEPRPRFTFYTMLPEMEVAVPEEELREVDAITTTSSPSAESGATYILQVGSFRGADEAERLKANLALLGFEGTVQTVVINGSDTWHRVRVGPYRGLKTLSEARARLEQHRIEAMVLRIKS